MLIKKHVRIESSFNNELTKMAKQRGIIFSALVRELIELGFRVKKHMENDNSTPQEQEKFNVPLLEKGATSSMEALLLLRKMAHNINEKWVTDAHEEAFKRIDEILQ